MRLTIDTEKDSKETIIKAINFLKGVIGDSTSNIDNHGSSSGFGQDTSFSGELMGFLDADSVKTSDSDYSNFDNNGNSGSGFSLNEELKKNTDFDDFDDFDEFESSDKDGIRLVPY